MRIRSTANRTAWYAAVLVSVVLSPLSGCGGEAPVYEVSGTVSFEGQLVPYGSVRVVGTNSSVVGASEITPEGTYSLRLPAGSYSIGVDAVPPLQDYQPDPRYEGGIPPGAKRKRGVAVPLRYNDPYSSGLTLAVSAAGDNTHDIKLP